MGKGCARVHPQPTGYQQRHSRAGVPSRKIASSMQMPSLLAFQRWLGSQAWRLPTTHQRICGTRNQRRVARSDGVRSALDAQAADGAGLQPSAATGGPCGEPHASACRCGRACTGPADRFVPRAGHSETDSLSDQQEASGEPTSRNQRLEDSCSGRPIDADRHQEADHRARQAGPQNPTGGH